VRAIVVSDHPAQVLHIFRQGQANALDWSLGYLAKMRRVYKKYFLTGWVHLRSGNRPRSQGSVRGQSDF
jgi:hypothetical protein